MNEDSGNCFDPVLGRMNGVDPMASKYSSLTPYNYSFNSPTMHNDVSGADPTDQTPYWIEESMQRNARRYKGEVIDTYNQFAGLMRTTPQKMFEERSAGGYTAWSPSSNSLMSYGGITGAEYSQMFDDARNLTPQEYGEKYGERISVGQGMILMAQYNMSVLANSTSAMLGLIRYIGMDVAEKAYGSGGINGGVTRLATAYMMNNMTASMKNYVANFGVVQDAHEHCSIDLVKAVAWLNANASPPPPYGNGKCATWVINALKAGGAVYDVYADKGYAKNFGPTLLDMGLKALDVTSLTDYSPIAGDVAIIQPWAVKNQVIGHMGMYTGTQWASDYFQGQSFYPWAGSAGATNLPSFIIYRYTPTKP